MTIIENGTLDAHFSDHHLVFSVLNLKIPKPAPVYIIARNYKDYDSSSFLKDLTQINWSENTCIDDCNGKVEHFNFHFQYVLNRHAPVKSMKIRYRKCPFVSKELKQLMSLRNKKREIARRTGLPDDWQRYRESRDDVKIKLREAEKDYLQKEIYNNKNRNSMWKAIRNCIPRKETTQPIYTRDIKLLANEFNEFFTTVGARTAETVKFLANENGISQMTFTNFNSFIGDEFVLRAVSTAEVRKTVFSFGSNKAPGPDKVSMKVIKDALPCILPTLTEIINSSLLTSVFPDDWKEAEVIALLKDGDHEVPNNNRPVSLLIAFSKICERLVLNQLTDYLVRHKRLSKHQSGNKKFHSTETLNIFITDAILENMDNKHLTALLLLDLSKAFDSIEHNILLQKLRLIGVSKTSLEWFKSYLSDRRQFVRLAHQRSESRTITHGVPQGSILGPILFSIYINDLPGIPNSSSLESYVDDSKLFLSFVVKEMGEAVKRLNEDIRMVASWSCNHSLLINPEKTKLLVMGTRQLLSTLPEDFHVTLLGKEIYPVSSAKDLGIILDRSLTYDDHITEVVSKCVAALCQINRVKHLLDTKTMVTLIKTLVFSKLFYCSSVWSNTSKKNMDRLQKVQNFAARVVTDTRKFDHVTPVLTQLNWLTVTNTLNFKDAIMTYKCLNGLAPTYLFDRFKKRSQLYNSNTRRKDMLQIPFYRSAAGQRSFLYRAVKIWNDLPEVLKSADCVTSFKVLYKKMM